MHLIVLLMMIDGLYYSQASKKRGFTFLSLSIHQFETIIFVIFFLGNTVDNNSIFSVQSKLAVPYCTDFIPEQDLLQVFRKLFTFYSSSLGPHPVPRGGNNKRVKVY